MLRRKAGDERRRPIESDIILSASKKSATSFTHIHAVSRKEGIVSPVAPSA
jgi:hypothetical protein